MVDFTEIDPNSPSVNLVSKNRWTLRVSALANVLKFNKNLATKP